MPTNREPKGYRMRPPSLSAEAIALFVRCEELIRLGADEAFRDPPPRYYELRTAERNLMRLFGLNIFTDCSPLECQRPLSPGLLPTWPRAHELRKALLAAVAAQKKAPAMGENGGEAGKITRETLNREEAPANADPSAIHSDAPTRPH